MTLPSKKIPDFTRTFLEQISQRLPSRKNGSLLQLICKSMTHTDASKAFQFCQTSSMQHVCRHTHMYTYVYIYIYAVHILILQFLYCTSWESFLNPAPGRSGKPARNFAAWRWMAEQGLTSLLIFFWSLLRTKCPLPFLGSHTISYHKPYTVLYTVWAIDPFSGPFSALRPP